MFGKDFDSAKARHGKGNIDFGRRGDDELLSSDEEEEQGAEDASMEEGNFIFHIVETIFSKKIAAKENLK